MLPSVLCTSICVYLSLSSMSISGIAPNITAGPTDSSVIDGTSVILHCETSGAPRPAITWQKGQALISHLLHTHTPAWAHFWQKELYQVALWTQIHQSHSRVCVIVGLIVDCSGLLINRGDICSQISGGKMPNSLFCSVSVSFYLYSLFFFFCSEIDGLTQRRTKYNMGIGEDWREKNGATFRNEEHLL